MASFNYKQLISADNHIQKLAIKLFLQFGFAHRRIESFFRKQMNLINFKEEDNGNNSHNYLIGTCFLEDKDKGALSTADAKEIRKKIHQIHKNTKNGRIDKISKESILYPINNYAAYTDKYKDVFIVCNTTDQFHNAITGEVRNLTLQHFQKLKDLYQHCQYDNCNATNLQAAHFKKSRPEKFKTAADNSIKQVENIDVYDMYSTMLEYLKSHEEPKSLIFLCRTHHTQLDTLIKRAKEAVEDQEKSTMKNELKRFVNRIHFI